MRHLLLLAALALPFLAQAGGPWPLPKGKSYVKLSEWWLEFDSHYTDAGLTDPNVTTGIYNTFLYAEYGITDRLTGVVNANLFGRNTMNELESGVTGETIVPGEALNSFGDIDLALKYALNKPGSAWPISATLLFGIPTGEERGGDGQPANGRRRVQPNAPPRCRTRLPAFAKTPGLRHGLHGLQQSYE